VIGSTNAIWIDGDRDGKFSCAREYAAAAVKRAAGDQGKLKAELARYDQAVAIQASDLLATK
jgi:hypothetical protein